MKKIHTRNLITKKKFLRLENSPPPRPLHNFSNGPSLNIARRNGYAKQNIILQNFLANQPRRELSGIRKKEKKTRLHPGYYP